MRSQGNWCREAGEPNAELCISDCQQLGLQFLGPAGRPVTSVTGAAHLLGFCWVIGHKLEADSPVVQDSLDFEQ